jgi:hypothetical protein
MPPDAILENDSEESGLRWSGEITIRMTNQTNVATTSRSLKSLRDVTESDLESPGSHSNEFRANKREKPYKFYLEVREKLPEWWEEFNSALAESGMLKYRSVRQFALAKVKHRRQQELLCEMIGPRPDRKTSARTLVG